MRRRLRRSQWRLLQGIGLAVVSRLVLASGMTAVPSPSIIDVFTVQAGDRAVTEEVEVELDIFSGRPNPVWRLSRTEAAGLLNRLAALPAAAPNEAEMRLGYRGFIVRVNQGCDASDLRVRNGLVRVARGGRVAWYEDPGRAIERSLLESGRAHLADDLYQLVLEEWR